MFNKRFEVLLTEEQNEQLKFLAWKNCTGISQYIRTLIHFEGEDIDEEAFNEWKFKRNKGNKGIKDNERS